MRRIDIINSFQKISDAIKKSKVQDVFIVLTSKGKGDIEGLLSIFQAYNEYRLGFNDVDKKITKLFNFDELGDSRLWARIISPAEGEGRDTLIKIRTGIKYFIDFFPGVVQLLKQDNIDYTLSAKNELTETPKLEGKQLLTIILPEQGNELSSPTRIIKALESVTLLYGVFATITDTSNSDLSVAAIDSGSDKSFDFLGAAKLIEAVKELILGLWDRIVFYREKKIDVRLDLVTKSLPILEKISELQEKGTIGPEQAELLKRDINTATNNFISTGAIIPEFNSNSSHNPRQLMTPEPKLLAHSSNSKDMEETVLSDDDDEITEEEIKAMKKILAKRNEK